MREADLLEQLHRILGTSVPGLGQDDKIGLIRALCEVYEAGPDPANIRHCEFVPFMTGRRPQEEATHPGLGSSDHAGMILGQAQTYPDNRVYLLYDLTGFDGRSPDALGATAIDCTLSLAGTDASQVTTAVPGWHRRPVEPMTFGVNERGEAVLRPATLGEAANQRLVVAFSPDELLPDRGWTWDELDPRIRQRAADDRDPFTFGELFTQMVHVHLRVTERGVPVATTQTSVDICDLRRFGSLYQRINDRAVAPDTERQAVAAGLETLDPSFHPWHPVLQIGTDKAALYTHALADDIVGKKSNFTDPRWLMRVGLYLEFLTCLGITEAVKDDLGDLLTPAERWQYENSPAFAEIRRRLNPDGWRTVWALRDIQFPRFGVPHAGPVSALNLLQKKKTTLAFLEVHHQDLRHALDLAGANEYSAQETWHRVFRDAERAVLRQAPQAFPELSFLPPHVKNFVLWHQEGRFDVAGVHTLPHPFSALFGDQDGLFASACSQYRTSMNDVARWAKPRKILDYTGDECVPLQVSLLHAYMNGQQDLVGRLQHRDGYADSLDRLVDLPPDYFPAAPAIHALLKDVSLFSILADEEIRQLAATSRRIALGPMERIIVEGRPGSSLFVVGDGTLEVLVRQPDGTDRRVGVVERGGVVGEMSLLTGEPRHATVRSIDGGVVYEIGKGQYEPIIRSRPELIEALTHLMTERLQQEHATPGAHPPAHGPSELGQRIRHFFMAT